MEKIGYDARSFNSTCCNLLGAGQFPRFGRFAVLPVGILGPIADERRRVEHGPGTTLEHCGLSVHAAVVLERKRLFGEKASKCFRENDNK